MLLGKKRRRSAFHRPEDRGVASILDLGLPHKESLTLSLDACDFALDLLFFLLPALPDLKLAQK